MEFKQTKSIKPWRTQKKLNIMINQRFLVSSLHHPLICNLLKINLKIIKELIKKHRTMYWNCGIVVVGLKNCVVGSLYEKKQEIIKKKREFQRKYI